MQGISIYAKGRRPTFYAAFDDPITGRRVCRSTGVMVDDPQGKLKAYAWAREQSQSGIAHGQTRDAAAWEIWAEQWLRFRFATQTKTLTSYLGAWKHLSFFLRENKIPTPRALTYQQVVAFVMWRESQVKKQSQRKVSRNTALHNVKVLSRIMREAMRRGYAQGNPCFRLAEDVPPATPAAKEEYSDEQIEQARTEFARRAPLGRPSEWMPIAFEIGLFQCCRLSATQIDFRDIDLVRDTITFHEKGGQVFTVPLHPELKPLLVRLKAAGHRKTCTLPRFASRNFGRVMRALGLRQSFHCLRVTGITRMARAGIPEQQAMAYVHHGSWLVHKIYQRLKPADVRGCHAALSFSAPAPAPGSPQSPDEFPATPPPSPAWSIAR